MQIHRIQNNLNPQFQGIIKVQNFKKGGEIVERKTSQDLDRGLAQSALNNIFEGNWTNEGTKHLNTEYIARYADAISQTLGLDVCKTKKQTELVERKQIESGYSFKVADLYKITHIREDHLIWD